MKRSNSVLLAGVALLSVVALLGAVAGVAARLRPAEQCATPSQPSSEHQAESATPHAEVEAVVHESRREPVKAAAKLASAHGPGAFLAGRVVTPDGAPAAFALVHAEPLEGGPSRPRGLARETVCDEEGRFRIGLLADAPYCVSAARGTSIFEKPHRALLERVEPCEELVIVLKETHVVRGRVVDDGGVAVADFKVDAELLCAGEALNASAARRSARGGSSNGEFELRGLLPGTWALHVRADGHDPAASRVVTVPPDAGELTFRPTRLARLRGVTVDTAGEPLLGVSIYANPVDATQSPQLLGHSDKLGRFSRLAVSPGVVEVAASAQGYQLDPPQRLHLAPGERREVRLVLVKR